MIQQRLVDENTNAPKCLFDILGVFFGLVDSKRKRKMVQTGGTEASRRGTNIDVALRQSRKSYAAAVLDTLPLSGGPVDGSFGKGVRCAQANYEQPEG